MALGAETFVYSVSINDTINEGFLSYVQFVNGQPYPPLVHSVSWNALEEEAFSIPKENETETVFAKRTDLEFAKMGLRGNTNTMLL